LSEANENILGVKELILSKDVLHTAEASASLGQVHKAKTTDGHPVAVKVQRPDIRKLVEVDLEILLHLASMVERHVEGADIFRLSDVVREFARVLDKELDYTIEASHMEHFAWQFEGTPRSTCRWCTVISLATAS